MSTLARWNSMAAGVCALGLLVGCGQAGDVDGGAAQPETSAEDVPALSELEDTMWEVMLAADSVRVTAAGESIVAAMPDVEGIQSETFSWSGAIDGAAVAVHYDNVENAHVHFGETTYVAGEIFYSLYEQVADDIDFSVLGDELSNRWVLSDSFAGNSREYSTIDAIHEMRDTTDGAEVAQQGTVEELDGQQVWKYPTVDDEGWVKIAADMDAPYLLQSHSPEGTITYSGWDDTEIPVVPDEEEVVTEQEVLEAARMLAQSP